MSAPSQRFSSVTIVPSCFSFASAWSSSGRSGLPFGRTKP